ncbi:uncharacterized protein BO72DRAFT_476137 [Aspergillus fijiensis CBS 313.89]|uniref:Uncharacterized protein n=1 Tax=Aspergillus fijiensis CBS 313.89 TaxID=1448319 RepID=A0A8G1RXT9_9EURO|nr:uncharacterized protein BO72DRAFT_476137 [Aspergillus fijiensis CBS 313.89]RAK79541.1 hypothetical protein BO72DRAFT_476137 [Aspergillus fijiensis CBS 313.89]
MKSPASELLHQVHVFRGGGQFQPIASFDPSKATYMEDQEAIQENLLRLCSRNSWHKSSRSAFIPRPIAVSAVHQRRWKDLNEALVLAITDIVERWWTDTESRYPERMPLEPAEEELLRWIDSQVPSNLPPYRDCRGSWRPDFLVEDESRKGVPGPIENFRISEINARFSFNGMMYAACGQQALKEEGICDAGNGLVGTTEPAQMLGGLLGLFDLRLPLHLLKGDEPGIDIHMVVEYLRTHFGINPRFVLPADLRLVPCSQAKGGYRLCCVIRDTEGRNTEHAKSLITYDGETMEEIYQVGLELHQKELRALSPEMLRQVSLRCFNDLRTVLLVHDKRMLGLVRQELDTLVDRDILTYAQAKILEKGIADTILPGSAELEQLIESCKQDPDLKKDYILKPIRSGKGDGIVFGEDINPAKWMSSLEGLRSSQLVPGGGTCIVQRRINQIRYDLVLRPTGVMTRYPLVGTYHSIHGKFLGVGVWRSSPHRICAISQGGAWTCSVSHCS